MALHLRLRCDIINAGCLLYAFVQAWLAQCALSSIFALTNNYTIISFGLCHNCKGYEKRVLVSKLRDLMKTIAIAAVTAGGKTSAVNKIAERITNKAVLHLNDYYLRQNVKPCFFPDFKEDDLIYVSYTVCLPRQHLPQSNGGIYNARLAEKAKY